MDQETYRAYRGIVKHVLRPLRRRGPKALAHPGRAALGPTGGRMKRGTCHWCGYPAQTRRHMWHAACKLYAASMKCQITGSTYFFYFPDERREDRVCLCGERATELDHTLAIGVARRLGLKAYLRSLMPDNLRWLCGDCHRAKTRFDRAWMSLLDGREPKKPPKPRLKVGPRVDPRQLRLDIFPLSLTARATSIRPQGDSD